MNKNVSFRRRLLKTAGSKKEIRAICFSTLNDNEQQTIKCKLKTGISLEYSINGKTFQNYVSETPIDFGGDTKVYFRGNNDISLGDSDNTKITNFILLNDNVKTKCEGNIMFLINYDNIENDIKNSNQFAGLFRNCYSLVNAPELPATILSDSCYANMFYHCTNLIFAPKLPAMKLTQKCYEGMFNGCTSLVNAPKLPATTLEKWCYNCIFKGCVSLINAPELLSENIPYYAYNGMFLNCINLNYIKCLAKSFSNDSMLNWVNGVQTEYGTFIKNKDVNWKTGIDGIPSNWTVENI